MTNGNGKVELSPRTLVAVVVVALTLGAGGSGIASWLTTSSRAADHETRISVMEVRQEERDAELKRRLASLEQAVRDLAKEVRRN